MATYITDAPSLALFNAGLPPGEHVAAYWQLDQHEQALEAKREARAQSDMRLRAWYQERATRRY